MNALTSPAVDLLFTAYVAAQAKIDNVLHDREVEVQMKDKQTGANKGKYKYRYATLPGILNHIRDALTENGMFYTQRVEDGQMVTRLIHTSGQWMDTGHVPLPAIKGSPQEVGAIISFFKRYSLNEAMALAADDDNAGEDGTNDQRDVTFHPRGVEGRAQVESLDEPPMGWGDWARGLIESVKLKDTNEELDDMVDANKRLINSVKRVDPTMYRDIQDAFRARRQMIDDKAAI